MPHLSPFPGSTLPKESPTKPRSAVCEGVTSPALPDVNLQHPPGVNSCVPAHRETLHKARRASYAQASTSRSQLFRPTRSQDTTQSPTNNWFSVKSSASEGRPSSREALQRLRLASSGVSPPTPRTANRPSQHQENSQSPTIDWFSDDAIFD